MSKDTGGSAFPEAIAVGPAGDVYPGFGGMTLRDYFAAQIIGHLVVRHEGTLSGDAITAYAAADAMLKARGDS